MATNSEARVDLLAEGIDAATSKTEMVLPIEGAGAPDSEVNFPRYVVSHVRNGKIIERHRELKD